MPHNSKFSPFVRDIIVDFDETLCFSQLENGAFDDNGMPNVELIKIINELYDEGYTIKIYTARGYFSVGCNKLDRELAYWYRISKWLEKNNVKYHELSFDKPYGICYIDDKATTPESFIEKYHKKELSFLHEKD